MNIENAYIFFGRKSSKSSFKFKVDKCNLLYLHIFILYYVFLRAYNKLREILQFQQFLFKLFK